MNADGDMQHFGEIEVINLETDQNEIITQWKPHRYLKKANSNFFTVKVPAIEKGVKTEIMKRKGKVSTVQRTDFSCDICWKPQTSKHARRHFKTHNLSNREIDVKLSIIRARTDEVKECPTCRLFFSQIRRHTCTMSAMTNLSTMDALIIPDADNEVNNHEVDPLDDLMNNRINDKYPYLHPHIDGDSYYLSSSESAEKKAMINAIIDFFTSRHGKKKDKNASQVVQIRSFLNSAHNKLSVMLGHSCALEELLDLDLILRKDIDRRDVMAGSKGTYCSHLIAICKSVLWNKEHFVGTDRASMFLGLSREHVLKTIEDLKSAKNGYHEDGRGERIDRKVTKHLGVPKSEELTRLVLDIKQNLNTSLLNARPTEQDIVSFRDFALTYLAIFFPVRIKPLAGLSFGDLEAPIARDGNIITVQVGSKSHKTYKKYGSVILNMNPALYDILLNYADKMKTLLIEMNELRKVPVRPFEIGEKTPLFPSAFLTNLSGIGNIVSDVCSQSLNRKITATMLRGAKATLSRVIGICEEDVAAANFHSTETMKRDYVMNIVNDASIKYMDYFLPEEIEKKSESLVKEEIMENPSPSRKNDSIVPGRKKRVPSPVKTKSVDLDNDMSHCHSPIKIEMHSQLSVGSQPGTSGLNSEEKWYLARIPIHGKNAYRGYIGKSIGSSSNSSPQDEILLQFLKEPVGSTIGFTEPTISDEFYVNTNDIQPISPPSLLNERRKVFYYFDDNEIASAILHLSL